MALLCLPVQCSGQSWAPNQAPNAAPVYFQPGSIGYQLRTGYAPEGMPPGQWANFASSYFELSRVSQATADSYGQLPADQAVYLYPGLIDRLNLERQLAYQRQRQIQSWGLLRMTVRRF